MSGLTYSMHSGSSSVVVSVCVCVCSMFRFNSTFHLGEMLLRTLTLNSQVCSAVVSCTSRLRTPANDNAPFGCYDYLSVYHPEEHTAVMELLTTTEKGHMTIT